MDAVQPNTNFDVLAAAVMKRQVTLFQLDEN